MRLIQLLRTSFTARLCLWVAAFVTAVFMVTLFLMLRFSKAVVQDESIEKMKQLVEDVTLEMDNALSVSEPDFLKAYYQQALQSSPRIAEARKAYPHSYCLLRQESGHNGNDYTQENVEGERYHVFSAPLEKAGWRIKYYCPERDILADYQHLRIYAWLIVSIGLLLVLLICGIVIERHIRPLRLLASATQRIIDGHFDEKIPDSGQKDEIGQLQNSFSTMQHALSAYIDEMRRKTTVLRQHSDALMVAYQRAQEDDRVKTAFITNITDQMTQPVSALGAATERVTSDYHHLSREEMDRAQMEITTETSRVTQLLDQILLTAQENELEATDIPVPESVGPSHLALSAGRPHAQSVSRNPLHVVQHHLSMRLGLLIVLTVTVMFVITTSILFYMSKNHVRQEAIGRATQLLDNTALRMTAILGQVERASDSMAIFASTHHHPDSLVSYSRRLLTRNPAFYSCSVSMDPQFFLDRDSRFSLYTLRENDSILTERYDSDTFPYSQRDWYRKPKEQKEGCWIDPYSNARPGATYTSHTMTSYARPVFSTDGQFIGVITIDLRQLWFSQAITSVSPYPHSSSIMIGKEGHYFVHPDTAKLLKETIFSDPDPQARQDVIPLGQEMIAGHSGMQQLVVDGNDALVFYRPIGEAGWSIAIVCPESDVFSSFYRLRYSVWIVIIIGLVLLLLFCYQTIHRATAPLKHLAQQAQDMAEGHFNGPLEQTTRANSIGQLQNSFVRMQRSISKHIQDIQQMNLELEQRNEELLKTNELAREAEAKKTAFIQDMTHQIRTPLNIIGGFAQVLSDNFHELPEEEVSNIVMMMQDNSRKMIRIARMLTASSATNDKAITDESEVFGCNSICHEAIQNCHLLTPHTVRLVVQSDVPDTLTLRSNKKAIAMILGELLDNANKFTQQGIITLSCHQPDAGSVAFTVSDTGIGIADRDQQRIFAQFTKVNVFTEGIGLGLHVSRHIAQLLGGELTLDTSYHDGARFVLTLPV